MTALLFFISISLFSQDEKRLALVIGNANYDKGELKNPVNDARLIASTLDSLDFDVILKENLATEREMTLAIREFGNKRSEYDVAFVYYAGHGIQIDDENFLLPTKEEFSSKEDVLDFGVSVQNIMRYLRSQTNEVNILILDACRDNPFESNWNSTRSLKGSGLAKIPAPTGSLIAFSTDSGQTAPDGDGDNSTYTISLAKNMLLEDTSIDQVFRNVRAEVLAQTDGIQRPVEATQLTGQTFYLLPNVFEDEFKEIERLMVENINVEKALELSNIILSKDPENYKALKSKAHSLKLINKSKEADEVYKQLIKKDSSDISNYYSFLIHNDYSRSNLGIFNSNQDGSERKKNFEFLRKIKKTIELEKNPWFLFIYIREALATSIQEENINELFKIALNLNVEEAISSARDFFILNDNIIIDEFFYKDLVQYYNFYFLYMNDDFDGIIKIWNEYSSNHPKTQKEFLAEIIPWLSNAFTVDKSYDKYIEIIKEYEKTKNISASLKLKQSLYDLNGLSNFNYNVDYLYQIKDYIDSHSLSEFIEYQTYSSVIRNLTEYYFYIEKDYIEILKITDQYLKEIEKNGDYDLYNENAILFTNYLNYLSYIFLNKPSQASQSYSRLEKIIEAFDFYNISSEEFYIFFKNENYISKIDKNIYSNAEKIINEPSKIFKSSKNENIVFKMIELKNDRIFQLDNYYNAHNNYIINSFNSDLELNIFAENSEINVKKLRSYNYNILYSLPYRDYLFKDDSLISTD